MTLSAISLALIGISLTFLPKEISDYIGTNSSRAFQLIIQLLGALYFAFAMLNWMVKGSAIGGIFSVILQVSARFNTAKLVYRCLEWQSIKEE